MSGKVFVVLAGSTAGYQVEAIFDNKEAAGQYCVDWLKRTPIHERPQETRWDYSVSALKTVEEIRSYEERVRDGEDDDICFIEMDVHHCAADAGWW